MAILKQIHAEQGSNAAQIDANLDWATAERFRISDLTRGRFGAANTLRVVNLNTTADIVISFTFDVARSKSFIIRANSTREWTAEDGLNFYGFDIYSNHATENLAIGDINFNVGWIKQIPEVQIQEVVNG